MSLETQQGEPERSIDERLAGVERTLQHLKDGPGALGLKPCGWCGVYYRYTDKGAQFHYDEFVCSTCVSPWWSHRYKELSAGDRKKAEREVRRWLVSNHQAEMILGQGNGVGSCARSGLRILRMRLGEGYEDRFF